MVTTDTISEIEPSQEPIPLSWRVGLGIVLFIMIAIGATLFIHDGPDWHIHYRPAGVAFWEGQNIFLLENNYPNPPWAIVFIAPLALLPIQIGRGIWFAMGFFAYVFAAYRLGARGIGLIAFMVSPPVLHGLLNANVDWMVLIGAVIPLQWGLLMLSVKPQVGAFAGLYLLYREWRENGLPGVAKAVTPTVVLTIAFMFVYGLWFMEIVRDSAWALNVRNDTLWPWSIPFGLIALYLTWKRKDVSWSIAAGPLLFPYASFHSYVALLMPFCKSQKQMLIAVGVFWLLALNTLLTIGI